MRTAQRHKKSPSKRAERNTVAPQSRYNYHLDPWAKVGKRSDTTKQLDGNITAK